MRSSLTCALIAASFITMLAAPAHALRPNTYVASYGADTGTCSYSAPCRSFSFALSQVEAGGVVTAIDSAGNSPFTIDKAVTIMAPPGVSPSIQAAASGTAITINAGANDSVVVSGLTLNGVLSSASFGIQFNSGSRLEIINCAIHSFQIGVAIYPTAPASLATLLISNTIVSDSAANAIYMVASNGASIIATLDHITANNSNAGVVVTAYASSPIEVWIKDSTIDNNIYTGISVAGVCGSNAIATAVLRSVSLNETPHPITATNCSNIWMSHVVQPLAPPLATGNAGVSFDNTSHVFSDGTNLTSNPPEALGCGERSKGSLADFNIGATICVRFDRSDRRINLAILDQRTQARTRRTMVANGTKRHFAAAQQTVAIGGKADITRIARNGRF
jgi:hypothetical protein